MDIKKYQTEIRQTKSPAKTLQMKPQVKRLQSNINEHLCFLFITSNNKAKCIRPWTPILVFSQLNFQDFHHVFHRSLSTAWKPSVVLLPFHRRIPQAAPSISSPNTARDSPPRPRKKRRAYIIESDNEDWTWALPSFSELLRTSRISWMKFVFPLIRLTEFLTHDIKVFLFCIQNEI